MTDERMDALKRADDLKQRIEALARANEVRARKKDLKRRIRDGSLDPVALLHDLPDVFERTRIDYFLKLVPYIGAAKSKAICRRAQVMPTTTLGRIGEYTLGRIAVELETRLGLMEEGREARAHARRRLAA